MIDPAKLNLMRKRLFIPHSAMNGMGYAAAASLGPGDPVDAEIGSTGIGALLIDTSTDGVCHLMMVPDDLDRSQPIYVRVLWHCDGATLTDEVLWGFTYTALTPNTTVVIDPATALDTILVKDMAVVQNALLRTEAGVINANSIADAALYWAFKIIGTDSTGTPIANEEVSLFGVEFEYTPKLSQSQQGRREAAEWKA
jgi:hypothetical protein